LFSSGLFIFNVTRFEKGHKKKRAYLRLKIRPLIMPVFRIQLFTVVQIPPVCQKWPMSSVKLEGGKLGGKYPKKADAMRL